MRSKLRKLLRALESESGFRNEYSEYSEADNCSYEVTENIDFPNFRLIGKKFNERYPTTYGSLLLYSDTAIRAELVRMESDGLVLIGTQKATIQAMPRPSNAGPEVENAESTTERVILTTQGKSDFLYFIHKITKEPVSFLFSSAALIISIVSLFSLGPAISNNSIFQEFGVARLGFEGQELKLLVADTKGQLGKLFLFQNDSNLITATLSVENPNIEGPKFRIVKGHNRDWLVVTTIESSGTGYMKHIDTWYVANPYYQGNLAVLSYPSDSLTTDGSGIPTQKLTTSAKIVSDDSAVDVESALESCEVEDKCITTTKTVRYVWDSDQKMFVPNNKKSDY